MSSPVAQVRTRMPRIAEVAVERARLTVVPRRRTRAARMPFVALVSMVLLGGVVGLLLFNTSMQQASFAATALEEQANTLAARQQTLQMDLDRLRNPQRIAAAAQKLGMVPAGNVAFLELGSGRVVGDPSAGDGSTPLRIWPLPPPKPASINPPPTIVEVPAHESAGDGRGNRGSAGSVDENHGSHQNHRSQQTQH
jgi:type II secretory pathway pseudopilin PulG